MYIKENNNVLTNYVVIREETEKDSLHFYVKGDNENLVKDTSDALLELLNIKKKSKKLRLKYWMDEQVKLENGCVIGVVGSVKKPIETDSEIIGNERVSLLKETVRRF